DRARARPAVLPAIVRGACFGCLLTAAGMVMIVGIAHQDRVRQGQATDTPAEFFAVACDWLPRAFRISLLGAALGAIISTQIAVQLAAYRHRPRVRPQT